MKEYEGLLRAKKNKMRKSVINDCREWEEKAINEWRRHVRNRGTKMLENLGTGIDTKPPGEEDLFPLETDKELQS